MVGPQQGSKDDYGLTFREQVLDVRIIGFLLHRRAGVPRHHLPGGRRALRQAPGSCGR